VKIRTGLWLYRLIGGSGRKTNGGNESEEKLERLLDAGRRWSVFNFQDAQCEFPERLVAEWLVEAIEAGAVVRNHTQVLAVDVRHGRAKGVLVRDRLNGKEERVEGTWIINATGPWADRVCQRSQIKTAHPMLGGVRGSHIVIPRFAGSPDSAVYSEAEDRRPFFVIPWNEQILVGTTEVEDSGDPAKAQPSTEEVQYLLHSFAALFPRSGLCAGDIRYAFAGIRSLPYVSNTNPSAITRRHFLHDHKEDGAAQMISVIGGKLTTAASLARECLDKLGVSSPNHSRTGASAPHDPVAADLDPMLDEFVRYIAGIGGISESSASSIVEWHGKRSVAIAKMALSSSELRAPLCPHTEHIVAEAMDAVANECAMTLGDILLRRVPVALGACWSHECSREAALRIKSVMGWSEKQTATELEAFELERGVFLRAPASF